MPRGTVALTESLGEVEGFCCSGFRKCLIFCIENIRADEVRLLGDIFGHKVIFINRFFFSRVFFLPALVLIRLFPIRLAISLNKAKTLPKILKRVSNSIYVFRDSVVPHIKSPQQIECGKLIVEQAFLAWYRAPSYFIPRHSNIDKILDAYFFFGRKLDRENATSSDDKVLVVGKNFAERPNGMERKLYFFDTINGNIIYSPHPREGAPELIRTALHERVSISNVNPYTLIASGEYREIYVISSSIAWVLHRRGIKFSWVHCDELFPSFVSGGRFSHIAECCIEIPRLKCA